MQTWPCAPFAVKVTLLDWAPGKCCWVEVCLHLCASFFLAAYNKSFPLLEKFKAVGTMDRCWRNPK